MDESGQGSRATRVSKVTLPKLDPAPASVLAFLEARFPAVDDWSSRVDRGLVREAGGAPLDALAPYRAGLELTYFREVAAEPEVPFAAAILHQDDHLLVADKPHFLPVTPAGAYVRNSLLARLQEQTGLHALAPLHRLDRDTAGLVLFSAERSTRGAYSRLFSEGRIAKTYHAVSPVVADLEACAWRVENRVEPGDPFFRMRCGVGVANARSDIRLMAARGGMGLFEIRPETGKKHQVRLHMAAIGQPILHDRLYPDLLPEAPPDFEKPLQLLAWRLDFEDPVQGGARSFESRLRLARSPSP